MKVVYYVPDITNPFWGEVAAGIEGRAKTEGITVEVITANDGPAQLAQLQAYESKSPDGIFISPVDMNGIAALCRLILKSGVPILAIDQSLKPNVTGSIISGNMKGGMLAASYLADRLQVGSRVVHIKAEQDLQNVMLRSTSFDQEVTRRGLRIVERIQADSQRNVSYEKTAKFLREKKPFDAIFAENDNMALGAVRALKEAGHTPRPLIVGYDGIPEALEAIRNGSIDATIAQNPIALGQAAMEVFLLALRQSPFEAVTTVMPRLMTSAEVV